MSFASWIGDLADKVPAPVVMGQVRHLLTGAGAVAIVGGWAQAEWWMIVAGGLAYLVGAGWSWLQKLNDPTPSA